MDAFLGEIRAFGFTFAPRGWAQCTGQSVSIQQNSALFSLLGVMYGGNGTTSFNLPNLQGSAACSLGQGPGLSNRVEGQAFGAPLVTLATTQLPAHSHTFNATEGSGTQEVNAPVQGCHLGRTIKQFDYTDTGRFDTTLSLQMIGPTGGGGAHENRQPYLPMNFCICLNGIFPARP